MLDGLITNITIKDKKVLIEIDGEYHLFLYNRDLKRGKFLGLIKNNVKLTQEQYELLNDHVINRGKKRIMYLLGKQDYPLSKLEGKLEKEGYNKDHVGAILKPFLDKGYINDHQLIKRRIQNFKGYKSKREIEYKLKTSGFLPNEVKELVSESFNDEDELKSALLLLNKKFTLKKMRLDERELKKKSLGFLSRKGYPVQICFKAYELFMVDDQEK